MGYSVINDALFERTDSDGEAQLKVPSRRRILEKVVGEAIVEPPVPDRRINRNSCHRGIDGHHLAAR
jgi:hypothetical protein